MKLQRAKWKHFYKHKMRLSKLSAHDRAVYENLTSPENQVMNQLKYGGDEALIELHN